jgi:branched-chain amino acid transport system substrate-binding protein
MTRRYTGRRRVGYTGAALTALALAALTVAGCSSSSSNSSTTPASSAPGTAAASGTATGTPFVVGAMGTFGGVASGSTGDTKTVFEDWVDATNAAGGINGHPVKAILLDD